MPKDTGSDLKAWQRIKFSQSSFCSCPKLSGKEAKADVESDLESGIDAPARPQQLEVHAEVAARDLRQGDQSEAEEVVRLAKALVPDLKPGGE